MNVGIKLGLWKNFEKPISGSLLDSRLLNLKDTQKHVRGKQDINNK